MGKTNMLMFPFWVGLKQLIDTAQSRGDVTTLNMVGLIMFLCLLVLLCAVIMELTNTKR
jgi:hypothetical protein